MGNRREQISKSLRIREHIRNGGPATERRATPHREITNWAVPPFPWYISHTTHWVKRWSRTIFKLRSTSTYRTLASQHQVWQHWMRSLKHIRMLQKYTSRGNRISYAWWKSFNYFANVSQKYRFKFLLQFDNCNVQTPTFIILPLASVLYNKTRRKQFSLRP